MRTDLNNKCLNDDAAPLRARPSPAVSERGKRLRRRGPRSHLAILRRSVAKCCRTLPGISLGESRDSIPVSCLNLPCEAKDASNNISQCMLENRDSKLCLNGIFVYNVNIQCILAHLTELEYHLNLHRPHVVMIQETWLDDSAEHTVVSNYNVASHWGWDKIYKSGRNFFFAT